MTGPRKADRTDTTDRTDPTDTNHTTDPVGDQPDAVMAGVAEGLALHSGGDRVGAARLLTELWEQVGPDGDPFYRCAIAHYLADVQDLPAAELAWDLRALEAAEALTDARAQQYHASLQVRAFYPSLQLNLAADYDKLGMVPVARKHLSLARQALDELGDDTTAPGIREAIDHLAERLRPRKD
nr:hypothetical protein [Micromonospora sp. DSM 115978]